MTWGRLTGGRWLRASAGLMALAVAAVVAGCSGGSGGQQAGPVLPSIDTPPVPTGSPSSTPVSSSPTPPTGMLTVVHDVTVPEDLRGDGTVNSAVSGALYYSIRISGGAKAPSDVKRFDTATGSVTTVASDIPGYVHDDIPDAADLYDVFVSNGRTELEHRPLSGSGTVRTYDVGPAAQSTAGVVVVGRTALVQVDQTLTRVNLDSGTTTASQGSGSPYLVQGRRVLLGTLVEAGFPGASDLDTGALTTPPPVPAANGQTGQDLLDELAVAGPAGVYLIGDNEHGGPSPTQVHLNSVTRLDPVTLAQAATETESLGKDPKHSVSLAAPGAELYSTAGECGLADMEHVCVYRRDPRTLAIDQTPVLKVAGTNGNLTMIGPDMALMVTQGSTTHLLTLR